MKNCQQCGNIYYRRANQAVKSWEASKYCSRACSNISRRGSPSWNKGIKGLQPWMNISGLSGKGDIPWNKGKHPEYMQGKNHHWYGKKFSDEYKKKISDGHKGTQAKENNPAWKGGVTSQNKMDRVRFARTVAQKVFARDNYTCQICDQYNGILHADHIKPWADYPDLRFDLNNCRTVCRACHYYITFKRKMPTDSRWGVTRTQ